MLGYSNAQFISNIERGLANIPESKIKKLSKILNVPEEEVYRVVCGARMPSIAGKKVLLLSGSSGNNIFTVDNQLVEILKSYQKASLESKNHFYQEAMRILQTAPIAELESHNANLSHSNN